MPFENRFNILQTECIFLRENLQLDGTHLIDYLFQKKVLTIIQQQDIREVLPNSKKITTLITSLLKRPDHDFEHFMKGLEEEQDHIKHYLQECLEKAPSSEVNSYTDAEMVEQPEPMDADTEKDGEDDTDEDMGSNSEEDCGQLLKCIKDFKMDPKEQDVTLHVKVMKVEQMEEKSNKKQFMAVVADATSAVEICVREGKLFDKFQLNKCLVLRNVTWKGNVLFTKITSTATFALEIRVPENVTAKAFGKGEPEPLSKVNLLPDMYWFCLKGIIVKLSPLTKQKRYKKVLSHCQVKLKDDTGSVLVDVWSDCAELMRLGRVVEIESCKKRQTLSPDDPEVTTTIKSSVKCLPSSQLKHILKDPYQRGTLMGIDFTPYMSCPNPRCFRYQLTDGLCGSCQCQIPNQDQVSYGVATIDIWTQKGKIHSLTVYWPELGQLFRLFKTNIPPGRDKEKIVKAFNDLGNKTVKYKACGIVSKFKL